MGRWGGFRDCFGSDDDWVLLVVCFSLPDLGVKAIEDTSVIVLSKVNGDLSTYASRASYYESNLLRGRHYCRIPVSSVKQQ